MLKLIAVSAVLASTPLCFVLHAPQETGGVKPPAINASSELEKARADLRAARAELEECLDLLEATATRPPRRNCNPSRSSMLTQFQWMEKRGYDVRAQRLLDRIVEEHGNEPSRLNNVAWSLMTDKETAGQFDRVALALVQRMLARGQQQHRHLDTAALAHFLNGNAEEAVRLQREALAQHENDSDYRRRLRTYEAARVVAVAKSD